MRKHVIYGLMLATALMSALCSCGQSVGSAQTVHQSKRDNIMEVRLVSIDDSLPPLHNFCGLNLLGDTLIVNDHKSTDKVLFAYDIKTGHYIGSFGNFGAGPGELNNFGSSFCDVKGRKIYGLNGGNQMIVSLQVDSALTDSSYKALNVIEPRPNNEGLPTIIYNCHYVNDSLLICSVRVPYQNTIEFHLGHFNLKTGETTIIDDFGHPAKGNNNRMTVSVEDSLIVIFSASYDRIRLFDLQGTLLKTITGPDYSENYDHQTFYFLNGCIGGGKIFALYLNQPVAGKVTHGDIIILDFNGNYLKTMRLNDRIVDMVYHEGTGRLYVSTDGDPQFGYIQID